jgi:hypothetical protein
LPAFSPFPFANRAAATERSSIIEKSLRFITLSFFQKETNTKFHGEHIVCGVIHDTPGYGEVFSKTPQFLPYTPLSPSPIPVYSNSRLFPFSLSPIISFSTNDGRGSRGKLPPLSGGQPPQRPRRSSRLNHVQLQIHTDFSLPLIWIYFCKLGKI